VTGLPSWEVAFLAVVMLVLALLLIIWWRQQSFRWPVLLVIFLALAPLLSWWSGKAFQVPAYRAGCDGLCPGYSGAPVAILTGENAATGFSTWRFALNSLVYLVTLLSWAAILRSIVRGVNQGSMRRRKGLGALMAGALVVLPLGLAPLYLPPPEAQVRGDSLRVAINARREVYLYDQKAALPVLRVALEDVRPRLDGQPGLRVCLRTYTYFYVPSGHMYLDMTPEGVHSNGGGVSALDKTCWE
jgi:hypothetical protein